jgi:phospholipid/cholesterol/gamma-HCH transport system substrate-binding protein
VKISKELKTGIVVVFAVGLFIYGFNFLKGRDIFSSTFDLYAVYDHVEGLTSNNSVTLNGFKIGTVREVSIDPKTGKLVVHFVVTNDDARITKQSRAEIYSDGLLGSKALRLVVDANGKTVLDGDTLVGAVEGSLKDEVNAQILPLKGKIEGLVSSIDSVVTVLQVILNKDAREDLEHSFQSISNALSTFERTALRLDTLVASEKVKFADILTKVQSITTNLANNNESLTKAINNFENISDSLAKSNLKSTIDNANLTLSRTAEIMDKINRGEGTLGMLVNDKKLYTDLTKTNTDLDALIVDIKTYPGRYLSIFHRKDRPKKGQNPAPKP